VCGKGGYVRAVARDLGEMLGCHGHVTSLRRVWSGPFDADEGIALDEVERLAQSAELDARLLPLEAALDDLPRVEATDQGAARLRNGGAGMVIARDVEYGTLCWAAHDGQAIAIGHYKAGELHPVRVFNTETAEA
jgi:tRNA pseudouridine55 synthase